VNRALSSMFYRTLKLVAEIDIPLDAGDFCLLDRKVVDALVSLRERNRYLRGLRSWVCFRQAAVEFDRDARHGGVPKYRFWSSLGPALQAFRQLLDAAPPPGQLAGFPDAATRSAHLAGDRLPRPAPGRRQLLALSRSAPAGGVP